ncbi:MATE family efflux transporter [Brucepastera parasyntrophica]|uniref:MATE family efflux transporter n=1 Tax=Brucepastera parasyntrophica TaxID=2880008 RepID=UPI00210E324B|nr:MATE family efflux transporter [Brucepastera parasyntrophica]ULQ60075.1 MATE family efflux transporter [Brucepastera parasyntrophica]
MTEHAELKENKMGSMPIGKLLIEISLPMVISMLVQALYNIVDSLFVAKLSEDALSAVTLAFPVQNLMIAIATGTGVGINALLSKSLGQKNQDEANRAANNGIFLALCYAVLFFILGLSLTRLYFEMQTDNPVILKEGIAYVSICTMLSFGIFGQVTFERLLQSTGRTFFTMISQGAGAIINIILDPIMIFGLFGFPRMEVAGAALATVIGQTCAMGLGLFFNLKFNPDIHINLKKFRPDFFTIKKIYAVGIPSMVMASISSVMTFGMNKILMAFTSTATAVFGVYFRLQSFIFMPVFGLNNGMIPIIAYNYGAKNRKRITKTIKLSICYAVCIMLIGMTIFQVFPDKLLSLFNASESMMEIGMYALRIISLHFLLAGFGIVLSSVFQAFGHAVLSLIMSVIRQLAVLLPAAYILSKTGGLHSIWWSFPIAECVSVLCSIVFMRYVYKKEIAPMKN